MLIKKIDLARLKLDVDKLDIDKLETTPVNFSNKEAVSLIKKKCIKFSVKKKGYYNSFNSWIGKKRYCYNMNYFPELYSHSKNKIKIEVNLFAD